MKYMNCPFCNAAIGSGDDAVSVQIQKRWLGTHLAMYHRMDMIRLGRDSLPVDWSKIPSTKVYPSV
jgi:hypothetical protein